MPNKKTPGKVFCLTSLTNVGNLAERRGVRRKGAWPALGVVGDAYNFSPSLWASDPVSATKVSVGSIITVMNDPYHVVGLLAGFAGGEIASPNSKHAWTQTCGPLIGS